MSLKFILLKRWLHLYQLIMYIIYLCVHYTLAEGILILVRSLQCSKGDVSDPIKYIYS